MDRTHHLFLPIGLQLAKLPPSLTKMTLTKQKKRERKNGRNRKGKKKKRKRTTFICRELTDRGTDLIQILTEVSSHIGNQSKVLKEGQTIYTKRGQEIGI
jgi:hypothetical protein